MAEQRAHARHTVNAFPAAAQAAVTLQPLSEAVGLAGSGVPAELGLPEGWEVTEYAGKGGRAQYAVYARGRRMASGMTSAHSAARWAQLLAASHLWPAAAV